MSENIAPISMNDQNSVFHTPPAGKLHVAPLASGPGHFQRTSDQQRVAGLVNVYSWLKMAIEIVDLPIKNYDFNHPFW